MALKVKADGTVVLKNKQDVADALEAFQRLTAEIKELREESGLDDLEKDALAYKVAAQNYMLEKNLDQIQCEGFHGTLIRGKIGSHWIVTDDDEAPADAVSLQTIVERKFRSKITKVGSPARKVWMRMTKRVIDPAKLDELVAEKLFDTDELAPAWVEKDKAPYLRLYDDA